MLQTGELTGLWARQRERSLALRRAPVSERVQKLKAMQQWILSHMQEIAQGAYADLRKPEFEAKLSEIYPVLSEIRHTLRHLKQWTSARPVATSPTFLGTSAYVQPEPKGVCLIISPWNYPFNLSVGPLVSAVAAGNTVILKPSEYTTHTNAVIRKLVTELFSPEEVAMVEGDAEAAQQLLSLPFDHIFFTGSPAVGKVVMEAAARHLTSVTLELGGKSPTIVDETANIRDAAEKITWGKWLNAGQTCVAPDYLLVHHSIKDALIAELKQAAERLYGSDDAYTSIINQRHFERLNAGIADALNRDARVEFGGKTEPERCRIYPMVISELTADARLLQEEIFGPVLPVVTFHELREAIDWVNAREKPLAMYFFSSSKERQARVLKATSAGALLFNDCVIQFGHPHLPFGGVNHSGIGKAHGHEGFLAFSNQKAVIRQRRGFTMAKSIYPPYNGLKRWVLEMMLRYF